MEKYLRINSLAIAKAGVTSIAPTTANTLKTDGNYNLADGDNASEGDFVLTSTAGANGPAYSLDKITVQPSVRDEVTLNSVFAIPAGKAVNIYDKDTRRDNIIRCSDIVSIQQVGGLRDYAAGTPDVGLVYNGIEIQYTGGALMTIVFEGNAPDETKAGLFLDALINQIETHLQSSATNVMADFVIPPGSEEFVVLQRGSAAVAVS
jgi:hypothetical protein